MKYEVVTHKECHLYKVYVPVGDDGHVVLLQFIHSHCDDMTHGETDKVFLYALDELEKIYTRYGRFALPASVANLFVSYGFEHFGAADNT